MSQLPAGCSIGNETQTGWNYITDIKVKARQRKLQKNKTDKLNTKLFIVEVKDTQGMPLQREPKERNANINMFSTFLV